MTTERDTTTYRAVKVPVAFSVSVTGHRSLSYSPRYDDLVHLVSAVLSQMRALCHKYDYAVDLRLNTALAVGADQLAALAVQKANESIQYPQQRWSTQAILPFERESYAAALELGLTPSDNAVLRNDFATLLAQADRVYELADLSCIADPARFGATTHHWQNTRYQTLGNLLSQQADILLALWNGEVGGKGGTADVVSMALKKGKPVLWINPVTMRVSWLMPHHGSVDPIALASQPTIGPATSIDALLAGENGIDALIRRLLTLPDQASYLNNTANEAGVYTKESSDDSPIHHANSSHNHHQSSAPAFSTINAFIGSNTFSMAHALDAEPNTYKPVFKNRLLNFLVRFKPIRSLITAQSFPGKARATTRAFFYQRFVNSLSTTGSGNKGATLKKSDNPENTPALRWRALHAFIHLRTDYALDSWIPAPEALAPSYQTINRPDYISLTDEHLKPAMIATDAIATARGHMYRSSYVMTFLGGTIAVWIGLTGIFFKDAKHWYVLVELVLLAALTGFYYLAKARSWHGRWLNARHITESLRAGRFLVWLGLGGRRRLRANAPWSAWYSNAVMSTAPLPHHKLQHTDLIYLANELQYHVQEQINYHQANHTRLLIVHHRLDRIGFYCLVVTILTAAVFVAGSLSPYADSFKVMKNPVTLICAGLPALAGALLGIRFQADFERFADRSDQTRKQLEDIDNRLSILAQRQPTAQEQPLFEELILIVQDMTEVFEKDIEDWRFVYSARPNPEAA